MNTTLVSNMPLTPAITADARVELALVMLYTTSARNVNQDSHGWRDQLLAAVAVVRAYDRGEADQEELDQEMRLRQRNTASEGERHQSEVAYVVSRAIGCAADLLAEG